MQETGVKTALVFPGQGAHKLGMWEPVQNDLFFKKNYPLLCDIAGGDLIAQSITGGDGYLARNEVSSLLTVFISACLLERLQQQQMRFEYTAGYSVGQWSALYAAGACTLEQLLGIVRKRALLMNRTSATENTAMLGSIGLDAKRIQELCESVSDEQFGVSICNFNAPSQVTVGGHLPAIEKLEPLLRNSGALKTVRLNVAGAWHCWLLESAVNPFASFLEDYFPFRLLTPVSDNITGGFLPTEPSVLCRQLSRQLCEPVRWDDCIRNLICMGAGIFMEVGYGSMLSKFGYFIDRGKKHLPLAAG